MSVNTHYVIVCSGDEEMSLPVDKDTSKSPPNGETAVYLLSMENLKAFFPKATALFISGEQNKGLRIRNNFIEIENLDLKYRVRFSEGTYLLFIYHITLSAQIVHLNRSKLTITIYLFAPCIVLFSANFLSNAANLIIITMSLFVLVSYRNIPP